MKAYEKTTSVKLGEFRRANLEKIRKSRSKREGKKVTLHRVILDAIDGIIALELQRWQEHATNPKR